MIVDTSVLVGILLEEAEGLDNAVLMAQARPCRLSAASLVECGAVLDRDVRLRRELDDLLEATATVIEPVTVEQGHLARAAFRAFGKGSDSPAKLNFGDCFAYALAKELREPLLYVGDDFSHTDVRSVRD